MHTVQRVSGLGRGVGTPQFLCSLPAILHPRPWVSGLGFSGLVGGGDPTVLVYPATIPAQATSPRGQFLVFYSPTQLSTSLA